MQEVLWTFHGVDIDVDQVGGEVAWAESSTLVVVDPLGAPSDLDNEVVGFIGHVHHCCGLQHWVSHAGIICMHLAVPVLLLFNVGALHSGGGGSHCGIFAIFPIISGSSPLNILGSICPSFLPDQVMTGIETS